MAPQQGRRLSVISRVGTDLVIIALYIAFAAVVFWLHGPKPPLSIDHIAYFKLADDIAALNPDGAYWHSVSAVRTYGVLLAYLHHFTGDHVLSLKWLLAGMTVAYLLSAEYFCRTFTSHRLIAVAVTLASAVHVSFGTVFWGMTDFSASLNRSLAIPPMLLLLAWYFRHENSAQRLLAYPVLIYLSLLHLGTYHLLALLAALDGLKIGICAWRDRSTLGPQVRQFAGALTLVGVAYLSLAVFGLNSTSLATLMPKVALTPVVVGIPPSQPPISAIAMRPMETPVPPIAVSSVIRPSPSHASAEKIKVPLPKISAEKTEVPLPKINLQDALVAPSWENALDSKTAWRLEIEAQPWRNFPPPAATLLGAAGSLLFLVPAALAAGFIAVRRSAFTLMDQQMLWFAGCVFAGSYALQSILWILRHFMLIYPMNFEEVRMISFLMIPLLYFTLRGLDTLWSGNGLFRPRKSWTAGLLCLFLLQPIYLVRILPSAAREEIFATAKSAGWLDPYPSQRNTFAREYLRLSHNSERLYYPVQPVLHWLEAHMAPTDRVLTNRDDLYILPARVIGTSNGFLDTSSASLRRIGWSVVRTRLDEAIRRSDLSAIVRLGQECSARFAVVPWPVPGAVFASDGLFVVSLEDLKIERPLSNERP